MLTTPTFLQEAAWEVVDECIQLHGGMGFMKVWVYEGMKVWVYEGMGV